IGRPFSARIDGADHNSGAEGFFRTATKPVLKLGTRQGHSLRLTADHRVRKVVRKTRWYLDTDWCEAGQLNPGDEVLLNSHRAQRYWPGQYNFDEGFLLGMLVGDGTLKEDKAVLSIWTGAMVANGAQAGVTCGTFALMRAAEEA